MKTLESTYELSTLRGESPRSNNYRLTLCKILEDMLKELKLELYIRFKLRKSQT